MLRCYQNGDLEKIKLQPQQELERCPEWENLKSPNSMVFYDNDRVLAIVLPVQEGRKITLYALISRDCGYKSVSMVKAMRAWLKEQLKRDDIDRIDMTAQANFEQANRLAGLLGFFYEGTLHKFYNGIDFNIWGIWKWEQQQYQL